MLYAPLTLLTITCTAPIAAPSQEAATVAAPELKLVYGPDGICDPALVGAWSFAGYGVVASLQQDSCRFFSICGAGAWELPAEEFVEGLLVAVPGESEGRRDVYQHHLEAPYRIERLDELPAACGVLREWTPSQVFDAYAATMTELYPFFETRGFDWKARLASIDERRKPDLDARGLFELIDRSLIGLGDGHMQLSVEIEGEEFELTEEPPLVFRRLLEKAGVKDLASATEEDQVRALRGFGSAIRGGVTERLLADDFHRTAGRLVWGRATDSVGYLIIPGMGGFADEESLDAEVSAIHAAMDEILTGLDGIEALVIDVSVNGGGMDAVSVAFASHFADERRHVYSKGPATRPDIRHVRYVEPAEGRRFTGPIYVVSSDITASAAEIFQLCMTAQPHVTLVGAPAAGIFSDVIPKMLPNGWDFGMSIESYEDPTGACFEGKGVPIDVPLPIFEGADPLTSHVEALERVVALAESRLADGAARNPK